MDRFHSDSSAKHHFLARFSQGVRSSLQIVEKLSAIRNSRTRSDCGVCVKDADVAKQRESGRLKVGLMLAVGLTITSGCRRAAFNEYYVENMASEIRALEDRIYEYDSAYTALELENDDLRRAIDELRAKNYAPQSNSWDSGSLKLDPLSKAPPSKTPRTNRQDSGAIQLGPAEVGSTDRGNVDVEELDLSPKTSKPRKVPAPSPSNKPDRSDDTKSHSLLLEEVSPEPLEMPLEMPPSTLNSNREPAPLAPLLPNSNSSSEDELPPPATLPTFPKSNGNSPSGTIPAPSKDLNLELEMPTGLRKPGSRPLGQNQAAPSPAYKTAVNSQNASPQREVHLPELTQSSIVQGKIKLPQDSAVVAASVQVPVMKKVLDNRLVEIGFHPTLSRGHNFDDKPGDDGLYLVITPKNSQGEVVNTLGELTIVIEEPLGEYHQRNGGQENGHQEKGAQLDGSRRIAAWEVTPEELKDSLEPIGASQGFHLSLPWDDTFPEGNVVQVFLKYRLDDGRTLVNRRDITLRKPGSRQTTWTPR